MEMHEHMNEPINHVNCGQNAATKHSEQEMFHVVYLLNLFIATVITRMTETIASLITIYAHVNSGQITAFL